MLPTFTANIYDSCTFPPSHLIETTLVKTTSLWKRRMLSFTGELTLSKSRKYICGQTQ